VSGNGAVDRLRGVTFDPELLQGARNAVFTCLAVRRDERCVLITDETRCEIGAALAQEFAHASGDLSVFVLEDHAERPLRRLPYAVATALEEADVSCYAAGALRGELTARMEMTAIVNRRRIRHAHMVGITERIMVDGMRADFNAIDALSRWAMERATKATEIRVTSPAGTDVTATFSPRIRWVKTSGLITPEKWGNLPGGEIFTSPANVEGVYVCDGILGDWFATRYGDMAEAPLAITIEASRITHLEGGPDGLREDFADYVSTDENSNRVGEFALGTNIALKDLIGEILQDEKFPGVHIAFGHPYREHTGADWFSKTHVDVVGRGHNVWIDGELVIEHGRYLVDLPELLAADTAAS
jgi:leucyl aminopeptidase (aminopeptidase T)